MVYQFDHNWDGEVIAESRNEALPSLMGNHFPASDIPPQARALYTKNLIRVLADTDAEPALLQPALNPRTGAPLDLSFAVLRAMSPIHLMYMRNMGARAYMSPRLLQILPDHLEFGYVGRPERASPGEGYPAAHNAEQNRILQTALDTSLPVSAYPKKTPGER